MSKYEELERLGRLKEQGNLSSDEYEKEKQKILSAPNGGDLGMDPKSYALLLHLSSFIFPLLGPIILWVIGREKDPFIDQHGKAAVNFHISLTLYFIASFILAFVFIGFLLMIALAMLSFVFTILAAINASKGLQYNYPLSIRFIK